MRKITDTTIEEVNIIPKEVVFTANRRVSVRVKLRRAARCQLSVADGAQNTVFTRREPASARRATVHELAWDGRRADATWAPDGVYTLSVSCEGRGWRETWDPAAGFTPEVQTLEGVRYDDAESMLTYRLRHPSLVHLQLTQQVALPDGSRTDVVYRTLVNREARLAGLQQEAWAGYDESGAIFLPGLRGFQAAGVATSLPENAVIVRGNRGKSALEEAIEHNPPLRTFERGDSQHKHHRGLSPLEDHSPAMKLEVEGWQPASATPPPGLAAVTLTISDPTARWFLSQPTTLELYLDEKQVALVSAPEHPAVIRKVDFSELAPGKHRLVANWYSEFGPLAVAVLPFEVPERASAAASPGRKH